MTHRPLTGDNIGQILDDMHRAGMLIDPLRTALIIGYEAGDVQKTAFYAAVRGEDKRRLYLAEMLCAMADLIMQLRVLAVVEGIDFWSALRMGEERLYERIEDFEKKHLPRPSDEVSE